MKILCFVKMVGLLWMVVLFQSISQAGIISEKKRVIFNSSDKQQTLIIANTNAYPIIMQTWIDDGDIHNTPTTVVSPFIIIPPMASLAAGEIKGLRIMYNTQKVLPTDRESAFWINLYEVPPISSTSKVANNITVAMNTQIKLFYRPKKLLKKPDEKVLAQQLVCNASAREQGITITCHNPTPYYVSLSNLEITVNNNRYQNETQLDMMVPPFSTNDYQIKVKLPIVANQANILYSFIDDSGNVQGIKTIIAINQP